MGVLTDNIEALKRKVARLHRPQKCGAGVVDIFCLVMWRLEMTLILGINSAYHDSAACLISDGRILSACEEERFTRMKHGKPARIDNSDELPLRAIEYCLTSNGMRLADVDLIGFSFNPPKRMRNTKVVEPVIDGDWGSVFGETTFVRRMQAIPEKLSALAGCDISGRFRWIDHHLCHAASAFFVSPFDDSAIMVVDGIAEFATTLLAKGNGSLITRCEELEYPNSIGFLWESLARFLGFGEYDASKIMGLAAYGCAPRFRDAFRDFVALSENGTFAMDNHVLRFRSGELGGLERVFGVPTRTAGNELDQRYCDIAAALQEVTNEMLLGLTRRLHRIVGGHNLCLAGGVALNCTANAILQGEGPFRNIYIQPAANDAGTAIGAAYVLWNHEMKGGRLQVMDDPYIGPHFSDEEIALFLDELGVAYEYCSSVAETAAELIAKGDIVAWFQGKMEFGPRALGNRSLLADPRNPNARETLNAKVKHRELFRPLAPSMLASELDRWFKVPARSISSDFMLFAYPARPEKAPLIPAVVHADGTSRVQTINPHTNPRFHELVSEFYRLTGVPMLLNTSFNDSEPIVCTPADALSTFRNTRIDALVLGNFLVRRENIK